MWNMKVTVILIAIGALGILTKGLVQGVEDLKITGDYPNCCIIEISQNTGKSPEDLTRLAVIQIPVRNNWLKLVRKTRKGVTMIITIIEYLTSRK